MYRSEQVICHGRTDGARRVAVAVRVLPYIPPPCERDPIGALTHEGPYRPTTANGRYHHLRDVAGQPVDAPRPLDSCIVMRWCEGTWGALRYLDLLRIRLSLRLSLRHPIAGANLGKDAGRVLRALPDLRRSLTRWVRSVRISPDSSGPPDPLQQMVVVHHPPGARRELDGHLVSGGVSRHQKYLRRKPL